jgi:hypothetical protein
MQRPAFTLNQRPQRALVSPRLREAERLELAAEMDAYERNGGKINTVRPEVLTGNPGMTRKEANDVLIRSVQGAA